MKMNIEVFNKLMNLCKNYDPFTQYIDNYNQMKSAEKANESYENRFKEIMAEYTDKNIYGVPWNCQNCRSKELEDNLTKYLADLGIEVEKPTKKIWTAEDMKNILNKYDDQVGKALVKLYARQTIDEQKDHETKEYNNIGFNGVDAPILTSFAEFYQKKGFLSQKQLVIARKKIMKYANQLCSIVNEEV